MPREQINYPAPFEPTLANAADLAVHGESWPEPELSVSWNKAGDYGSGHVQVSLLLPVGYVKHLAAALDEPDTPEPSGIGAFSPALPRDELNKLIRTLRRARDQAYGVDE